jgi:phenylalanyl-tRNA synthetase beta chain
MRLVGYDKAPARLPRSSGAPAASPEALADRARELCAARGLHEIVSWGFVPRTWLQPLGGGLAEGIAVKNPISADYEVMRTSLLPGLIDAAKRNLARGIPDVALFEVGPVVRRPRDPKEMPVEPQYAAAIIAGRRPDWLRPGGEVDFFDAKRIVLDVLQGLGVTAPNFVPSDGEGTLHPGAGAAIHLGDPDNKDAAAGGRIGLVGEIHPRLRRTFGLDVPALYLEIALGTVGGARKPVRSVPPPRFPASTRDISFWIDAAVAADAQRALLLSTAEPLLRDLSVLEDYRDPKYAPEGKKGMLWTLTYRADDRTLTDAEVDAAHARIVAVLKAAPGVEIR